MKDGLLHFSGVPVICRLCNKQVTKMTYRKGNDGSYLCPKCYEKVYRARRDKAC